MDPRNKPHSWAIIFAALAGAIGICAGCQDDTQLFGVSPGLAEFENAGPPAAEIDLDKIAKAPAVSGPYRVVVGDVLEFQLPQLAVGAARQSASKFQTCSSRVSADGTICLPLVGELQVADKTLPEVESIVAEAYCPKYLLHRPTVVAKVDEYSSIRVQVSGAVNTSGIYELHSNERSLVAALMKAGGVIEGAARIRIRRAGRGEVETANLPIRGVNLPFADVALADGDAVEVECFETPVITVVGLVNKPGVFPYQPGVKYSLMHAVAMAGGVNEIAAPEFAKVYRCDADGGVVSAKFRISPNGGGESSRVTLKPGDVVAVEPTAATETRTFFAHVLRVGLGVNTSYGLNK